jgi:hypothetical protein
MRLAFLVLSSLVVTSSACDIANPSYRADGASPVAEIDASPAAQPTADLGAAPAPDLGEPPCYAEVFTPTPLLDDLATAYTPPKWLATALEALKRRLPDGYALLDVMKSDPQLAYFVDAGSFPGLMQSLMTACHEETHRWNDGQGTGTQLAFWVGPSLVVKPPRSKSFARSEILSMVSGNATQTYDDTYLVGPPGSYDFIALADELNAYTNGLACLTSVADQFAGTVPGRDGAVTHLYYLELYLKRARMFHPAVYQTLKADNEWQRFVRTAWARVHFWDKASQAHSHLGVADKTIWGLVNTPANLMEIELYTGQKPADVACHP